MNVNCIKIHSVILSITSQGVHKLSPHSYKSPHIHLWIFETLWVIIFWVRVTHKMLNVNGIKIYSVILSITCQGLINFPPLIQIPLISICEFSKPYELLCFELDSPRKMLNVNWHKNSLSNIIHHLSRLNKLFPTHTNPLISICEFSKP